jgi:hypothetical protein
MELVEVAVERLQGLAPPLPAGVEECRSLHPVEPRPQVGIRRELVEGYICPGESVLDKILGIKAVAGHAQGGPVELRDEGKHVSLEPDADVSVLIGQAAHCCGLPVFTVPGAAVKQRVKAVSTTMCGHMRLM